MSAVQDKQVSSVGFADGRGAFVGHGQMPKRNDACASVDGSVTSQELAVDLVEVSARGTGRKPVIRGDKNPSSPRASRNMRKMPNGEAESALLSGISTNADVTGAVAQHMRQRILDLTRQP